MSWFQMLDQWEVALLGDMALLEEVWPCWRKCVIGGLDFEVSKLTLYPVWKRPSSWLPWFQDVEFSAPPPALCLPGHCLATHHDDNGLNL
jgi:hypothetical protein